MRTSKPVQLWAVQTKNGIIDYSTLSYTRKYAIEKWLKGMPNDADYGINGRNVAWKPIKVKLEPV